MTTWYQVQGPGGGQRWAFSVRPDIWPPGAVADVADTSEGWLANWHWSSSPFTNLPLVKYEVPGAAEALILAGLVEVDYECQDLHWTEVSPPR